jgi:hypothetical protein
MMEADSWQGRLSKNRVPSYTNQSVLILNQNSVPCAAAKCDSLLLLLQKSLPVNFIQEQSVSCSADRLSPVPDLILVRPAVGEAAQELIQLCKEKWARASIIALLCPRWDRVLEDSASVLAKVDDFLSCPFHESELLLRVRRLLQSKGTKAISLEKLGTNEALHFGALVGGSESFVRAIKNIPPLAQSVATVLICGETGTGKELLAARFTIIVLGGRNHSYRSTALPMRCSPICLTCGQIIIGAYGSILMESTWHSASGPGLCS